MDPFVAVHSGLIPQIREKLTCMRVNGTTTIFDCYFDHVYVFLMHDLTLEETILAKHAYEHFLSSIRVTAKTYHANNVRLLIKVSRMTT